MIKWKPTTRVDCVKREKYIRHVEVYIHLQLVTAVVIFIKAERTIILSIEAFG